MSQKKKKAPEAQQLIDSLLDEKTPQIGTTDAAASARLSVDDKSFESRHREARAARDVSPAAKSARAEADANNDKTLPISQSEKEAVKAELRFDEATMTGPGRGGQNNFDLNTPVVDRNDNTVRMESRQKKVKPPEPSDFTAPSPTLSQTPRINPLPGDTRSIVEPSTVDRAGITELKTVVKMRDRYQEKPADFARPQKASSGAQGAPAYSSVEASLVQSEKMRIAQARISELEYELERVRRENEQLVTASSTLSRRTDELLTKSENLEIAIREADRIHEEEKKVFRGQLQSKEREIFDLRNRVKEMDVRLENDFKKIRVNERNLAHRLDLAKMERETLVAAKDKKILDLMREIDRLKAENEIGKRETQEHFNQLKEKQETIRRVVRALRIALTQLEGDEEAGGGLKKAE